MIRRPNLAERRAQSFWWSRREMGQERRISTGTSNVEYAKQIDAQVDALNTDMMRDLCDGSKFCGGKVGPRKSSIELLQSWSQWVQTWRKYYNDNVNVNFPSAPGFVARDELDSYRAQYDGYEKKFRATGALTTVPSLPVPPKGGLNIPWTPILVISGLLAGVYVYREIKPLWSKT